ncbi:unnamed protein product, partial [Musa banksii]
EHCQERRGRASHAQDLHYYLKSELTAADITCSLQLCSLRATNGIRGCTCCFTRKRDLRICHANIFSPSNTDPDKLHTFDNCSRSAQQSRSRDGGPPQGQDKARVDGESEAQI